MSHLVLKVRGVFCSLRRGSEDWRLCAMVGEDCTGVKEVVVAWEEGVEGGDLCVWRWDVKATGRRAWVQHFPWFTHGLQKPHSPSLQMSHFQKQSGA